MQIVLHFVTFCVQNYYVILNQDTVTGFLLAGIGHRTSDGSNFLVVKPGMCFHRPD